MRLVTRTARRHGTAAVEFAVASSVLLMLIFTAVDLGLLYFSQQALNNGVARAARYAVVNSTSSTAASITSQFTAAVTPLLGATQAGRCHVAVSYAPSNTPGGSVTVRASLVWQPFIGFDFMPSVTLTSADSLVIQH